MTFYQNNSKKTKLYLNVYSGYNHNSKTKKRQKSKRGERQTLGLNLPFVQILPHFQGDTILLINKKLNLWSN